MVIFRWLVDTGQGIQNVFSYFIEWLNSPVNSAVDTGWPIVDFILEMSNGLVWQLFPFEITRADLLFSRVIFFAIISAIIVGFLKKLVK